MSLDNSYRLARLHGMIAEFARPRGAKDKKPRKRRASTYAIGAGLASTAGGIGSLGVATKRLMTTGLEIDPDAVARVRAGDPTGTIDLIDKAEHIVKSGKGSPDQLKAAKKLVGAKRFAKLGGAGIVGGLGLTGGALIARGIADLKNKKKQRNYSRSYRLAEFARTPGAKDKQKRKSRGLMAGSLAVSGLGGAALAGGTAYKRKAFKGDYERVKNAAGPKEKQNLRKIINKNESDAINEKNKFVNKTGQGRKDFKQRLAALDDASKKQFQTMNRLDLARKARRLGKAGLVAGGLGLGASALMGRKNRNN